MAENLITSLEIAVVIPAFRAESLIQKVIAGIPSCVSLIIVVNDCSPDHTSAVIQEMMSLDQRLVLIEHKTNQGVGGAMLTGYHAAFERGADVIVKMDSDDQMDPAYLEALIAPILAGRADYTKGNRFLHESQLHQMPLSRRLGNIGLSFLTKLASGYWNIFDPTNGYTAIRASIMPLLNDSRIDRRYFYESSMLVELGLARAVVSDVYIPARYGDEVSSLSELDALFRFPPLLMRCFLRRIFIQYFIRDFTAFTLFFIIGTGLFIWGLAFGILKWLHSIQTGIPTNTGTVMLAVIPFILGVQFLLQALLMDIQNVPISKK